jgi:phage tail-like protein
MSIFLINRDPEPSESNLPVSTDVFLEVVDDSGADIDLTVTQVYIKTNDGPEVLAFDAGVFQPGFNGAGSASSSVATGIRRINIDIFPLLDSLTTVTVHVLSANNAGTPATLDESYDFEIEDLTPPLVTSAEARGLNTVRVTFDEAMGSSALTAANYTFARQEAPSVDVVAESVTAVSGSTFDVLTDIDLSPGRTYVVTVANAEDVWGNAVSAPFDNATFTAFEPPEPENREFVLYELLPQMNRNEDVTQDLSKFVACLQEVTDLLLWDIDRWPETLIDPDTADEQYVDAMLADLGNPFAFAESLSLVDKRRLLRVLVDIYLQKGTCIGIQNVIRFFLGIEVECDEWIDDTVWLMGEGELGGVSGPPVPAPTEDEEGTALLGPGSQFNLYAFVLTVVEVLTQDERDRITEIVEYMKPAHTHFMGIVEPGTLPAAPDHVELGLSELGVSWLLH